MTKPQLKKLIDSPETCVDDSLTGFVALHPNLRLLKDYRVVVRHDVEAFKKQNKVAIISGGGSGHEPIFAGFVGRAGLTAAIAGSVFTSPPATHILAALRAVENPAGILIFVINYTGDRLNFGIATERAPLLGIKCPIRTVTVGEDCALTSVDRSAGRRGLAGCVLLMKIAGALAEKGHNLNDIGTFLEKQLLGNMGTIGLSLSSCSLPGASGPIFELGPQEMELGLGVHGEAGVKRLNLMPCRAAVQTMLAHMTSESSAARLHLTNGESIVVLVNNLGGLSQLELNVACKNVFECLALATYDVKIRRFIAGTFMTSLDMQGLSITILKLMDTAQEANILQLLNFPCEMPAWPWATLSEEPIEDYKILDRMTLNIENFILNSTSTDSLGTTKVQADLLQECLNQICDALISSKDELNRLDQLCGDGDCGTTMNRGAEAIKSFMVGYKISSVSALFMSLAEVWESSTGGTTGAIYSLLLSAIAKYFNCNQEAQFESPKYWIQAFWEGTNAIEKHGKAAQSDRTMLDVLIPVLQYATKLQETIEKRAEILNEIQHVAEKSTYETRGMKAAAGRASYLATNEACMREEDPGAYAVNKIVHALIDALK